MSKELALKSKSFCSALWTAIYQSPNGDISPCCVWNQKNNFGNVNTSSIDDIYKSNKVKSFKKKMLNGDTLHECSHCDKIENDTGTNSSRKFFNDRFLNKIDWEYEKPQFYHWDLRISNLCNFKCRMCNHGLSSEWYDDWKSLGKDPQEKVIKINDKSNFWKQMESHYPYVESIYFAGGEPFMNEHHYTILQELVSRELFDTKIIVNTNASITHWRKKKVLDYYKPFNHVLFGFSIDGSYEVGEYIRKGLDYKKWKENVKEYIDYISERDSWDITYVFQCAYGITNISNICDMIMDFAKSEMITKYCQFQFQPIIQPINDSVISIPPSVFNKFKKDVEKLRLFLKEYGLNQRTLEPIIIELNKIIRYIESNPFEKSHLIDFYEEQKKLDKLRNENIYDIIPDYTKLAIDSDGKELI